MIFFFIAVWILTAPIHSIDEQEILNLVILNFLTFLFLGELLFNIQYFKK